MANFDPDALMSTWTDEKYNPLHNGKTFEECIRDAFNIPKPDNYVYRAQGETTLAITQRAIGGKRAHGMHNWYHDEAGQPVRSQPLNPPVPTIPTPHLTLPRTTHRTPPLPTQPPTQPSSRPPSPSPKPSTPSPPILNRTPCAPP